MDDMGYRAVAIVGAGAILPDAPNVPTFWNNIKTGRYSITEVAPERWDPALYFDPNRNTPDKTYSKIGGWVRESPWDPFRWRLAIPPRVAEAMDGAQRWGIACTREVLADYGYPERPLNTARTAVILGNAMGGEQHYLTALRAFFPEYSRELDQCITFAALPVAVRRDITREWHDRLGATLPPITEDSMPGELANCLAGRIANVYNLLGPNFTCDAACASALAAIRAAADGLAEHDFDAAITGGIDRNMGAPVFIKFSKIGALSGSGSRPYAEGADGFVMGEGAALFLMKRLEDAERDGDRIYAVIRGIGASADGKGKGITAPNPAGQKIAVERAWQNAGLSPATVSLIEGHGTSTSVGDVVEVEAIAGVLQAHGVNGHKISLGSVKSNIGHLKGAAGAAGVLKIALALRDKLLPPSVNCEHLNPNIDFAHSPLAVNRELRPWENGGIRRAGVSAFGFGGTNFHVVMEEYVPGQVRGNGKRSAAAIPGGMPPAGREPSALPAPATGKHAAADRSFSAKAPLRGALVAGTASAAALVERLRAVQGAAQAGRTPAIAAPLASDLRAPERVAIDYGSAAELAEKCARAIQALEANQPAAWKALRAQGIFRGHGPAPKVAFLYPGQGSQFVNMLAPLRAAEPIIASTFEEADRVMAPILGKPLTRFIDADPGDAAAVAQADEDLKQTAITQPAVLAADLALTRLLAAYGIRPDMTMGHSLGEYGALVAAGAMPFAEALQAVSARGGEMTRVAVSDPGRMAAVFAPLAELERILRTVDGYVVIANINSEKQAVIGGASQAVEQALEKLQKAGYDVVPLRVSHAFHTSIVAPASEPLRRTLERLPLQAPQLPVVANVDGEFYPTGPDARTAMVDILARQIAAPVQFVKGLRTLYAEGARVFVEVGPKKALHGFAEDILSSHGDVLALFTNHPKVEDRTAFNQALCGLYAAGLGAGRNDVPVEPETHFAPRRSASDAEAIMVTGASLGLPGGARIFDDANVARILHGEGCIDVIPTRYRRAMLDKHISRLVKSDNGGPVFEEIRHPSEVIKLAGRGGAFDLQSEFGIPAERVAAFDRTTQLAIGVGLDALRDAGIPLIRRYKNTSKGTRLPDRWGLPAEMRDSTAVIFACVFPGYDAFADESARYYADRGRRDMLAQLEDLRDRSRTAGASQPVLSEMERRLAALRREIEKAPYSFDRRFIFRTLAMGHSQFAELIGARGPNTALNAACASTTQAVALAGDWIRAGRCRRVIVVSADDITSDHLLEWFGSAFLASGAAATDDVVEEAAVPFDRRRHGMIIGMGAAAMVLESAEAAAERGLRPICEVLSTVTANSAFHGTRLDVEHISNVMEELVRQAETRAGIRRQDIASATVFVSHETYTPARGGSASAEIHALRAVFGDAADRIVIANTKGFTGHAMGAGIEDVVAVKVLETGIVPPVANFREVDPELGPLNLSRGGAHEVEYALRLGAGFGSQICMTLERRIPVDGPRPLPDELGYGYRITDRAAWQEWLERTAGSAAELEVVQRTLRVRETVARPAVQDSPQRPVVAAAPPPAPAAANPINGAAAARERSAAPPAAKLPTPPPPPKPQPQAARDTVADEILALVVEKTGYPREMLDPDLDLEADLGIDTVKQAEMFAAIRERYGIPRDPNLKLREFPTLARVIQFARDGMPAPSPAAAIPQPEPEPPQPADVAADSIRDNVLDLVVEKTGYPREMLDLDLDLEADLGVDTVKQAEMFAAIRETYHIPRDPNLKLREFPTLARVIQFARDGMPAPSPAAAVPQPTPEPPQPADVAADSIRDNVLDLVVEKTGYPREMLDLDLDLEADLGVDTVKQAEMFAAIRETYHIPRDPNLKLREFPTLALVIQFVRDRLPAPQPAVAAPQSVPPTPEPPQPADTADPIRDKVLDLVVEKTGYPREMLDPELDMEADLGIDTVKQAEMFAAIRETYHIPRDPNLKLREFPTLGHVIRFARDRAAAAVPAATAPEIPTAGDVGAPETGPHVDRYVPAAVLRPPLEACKPTGVSLGPGVRVLIASDRGGAAEALAVRLRALGVEIATDADAAIDGVFWLPALDAEGDLNALDPAEWRAALELRVKALYRTMRRRFGAFLLSATRLGGRHGYDEAGAWAPLGGAVTGFTKAYKRERPEELVKAVDFAPAQTADEIADLLIQEALRDPGAVETGYADGHRWSVALERKALAAEPGMALGPDTVFVVTGAAGSIVSAITADLAAASGGTFYLLDMVPEPDPANTDLKRFASDKEGLKRDLFARLQTRGERATPALVEKELAAIERAQAAQSAIDAVRHAGGKALYFSVDLTDGAGVAAAVEEVRHRNGRIDVLLHAAGMERSRGLPDKDEREFNLVFDVKSDGLFHLLHAIGDMPLGALVAFSSVAGRFGNAGQADYSAANDLLCKIASSFRHTRPATRALTIDWTAWGGIGMASRGSIPKIMQMAGIEMLPPAVGIPWVRRELTAAGGSGEVLVAAGLGALVKPWDDAGGLDSSALPPAPMTGTAKLDAAGRLSVVTTLDPAVQPFLHDHVIDGTPVLPGVMGLEAFAEAALAAAPGWNVAAIEAVDFLAPFKFYRGEPREVTVEAEFHPEGSGLIAECRLTGRRQLQGQAEPQITTHFTGRVRLAKQLLEAETPSAAPSPGGNLVNRAAIYQVYFHGPAYQVLDRVWWDQDGAIGEMAAGLPENHVPAGQPLAIAPRLIELCFQTAGLWEMAVGHRMGLPSHVASLRFDRRPAAAEGPLYAVVAADPETAGFRVSVVDRAGTRYMEMRGYRTAVFREDVDSRIFAPAEVAMV